MFRGVIRCGGTTKIVASFGLVRGSRRQMRPRLDYVLTVWIGFLGIDFPVVPRKDLLLFIGWIKEPKVVVDGETIRPQRSASSAVPCLVLRAPSRHLRNSLPA